MARRIETQRILGPAGGLEALLEEPEDGETRLAALVCHPHPLHGGTMHNKVVHRLARGLRRAGAAVLRFNFRGVGRSQGSHGYVTGEVEDTRAALDWLRGRYPELPFGLAGFSFGARVITQLGCTGTDALWLMAAGFPASLGGAGYLENCGVPKIFIHSTNDRFGPRDAMEALSARVAPPKELVWIEAKDHFFTGALEQVEEAVIRCATR